MTGPLASWNDRIIHCPDCEDGDVFTQPYNLGTDRARVEYKCNVCGFAATVSAAASLPEPDPRHPLIHPPLTD